MRREAPRTLYSLSRSFQSLPADVPYEVLAVDNGSSDPLNEETVRSIGPEFRHIRFETASKSPCSALNRYIQEARHENVVVLIDGARILSPGVIRLTLAALRAFEHPFIYTLGMHVGYKPQNLLVAEGYNQQLEDMLLGTVDWKKNGYALFSISSVALSSKNGFFSRLSESNCFCAHKDDLVSVGMYNTGFTSPGGGLCNLDIFNRFNEAPWVQPVMLLGESTFHQFHGGFASNVTMEHHPWNNMAAEYEKVIGQPYENKQRDPVYLGAMRPECSSLYTVELPNQSMAGPHETDTRMPSRD
jgi:glycosyltransferase involved in cell wall biosynthesis